MLWIHGKRAHWASLREHNWEYNNPCHLQLSLRKQSGPLFENGGLVRRVVTLTAHEEPQVLCGWRGQIEKEMVNLLPSVKETKIDKRTKNEGCNREQAGALFSWK